MQSIRKEIQQTRYIEKTILLILVLLLVSTKPIYAQNEDIQEKITQAFMNLEEASRNGGDVSNYVTILNEVIESVKTGDYEEEVILGKLELIISNSMQINQNALEASRNELILRIGIVSIIAVLELAVWRYFPKIYWRIWLNKRGEWMIDETR